MRSPIGAFIIGLTSHGAPTSSRGIATHETPEKWEDFLQSALERARAGDARGLERLLSALRWRHEAANRGAVDALVSLGEGSFGHLQRLLESGETATERRSAAGVLGRLKIKRARLPLQKALGDPNMSVRRSATEALWRIGAKAAVPEIIELLADESGGVRVLVAEVLGRFRDPKSVPSLIGALQDSKWYVRQTAAKALGAIGDRRAIPKLKRASGDSRAAVARAARKALKDLGE